MKFLETPLAGVVEIEAEPHLDDRGGFARLYCPNEFEAAGINFRPTQVNLSTNCGRHLLRGLHYQNEPHAEAKLVRCTMGRIWDVAVDLTTGCWHAVELSAEKMNAVFLPEGVAHGFLTLTANAHVLYQMGRDHVPGQARGIRWDDPDLGIDWPASPEMMSDADREWPRWRDVTDS